MLVTLKLIDSLRGQPRMKVCIFTSTNEVVKIVRNGDTTTVIKNMIIFLNN